jgi:hypothetical protein
VPKGKKHKAAYYIRSIRKLDIKYILNSKNSRKYSLVF